MIVALVLFALCLLAGLPIYLALLGSGFYLFLFVLKLPPQMIVHAIYDSLYMFTLAAVPFFILMGVVVERSSMSSRLTNFMLSLVGRFRGGIPLTGLLANAFFGAICGSAPAATAAIGKIMYPAISEQHGERMALGLLTSAGGLAIIIPPSITMILYGSVASVSVGTLFLTGIVPGFIIIAFVAPYLIIRAGRSKKSVVSDYGNVWRRAREGVLTLILPVIILGGIYAGIMTPTEAGAIAAAYVFVITGLVYRELKLRTVLDTLGQTVWLTGQIFIIIAASGVFSRALSLMQVPQTIAGALGGIDPLLFFLMFNLLFLLLGMFLDPASAVLVTTPLIVPIALSLGIDLIHMGLVMVVNLAIGMFTPPIGLNLFVAQSIFSKSMKEVVVSCLPFLVCYLLALIVITYVPALYMWLPPLLLGT